MTTIAVAILGREITIWEAIQKEVGIAITKWGAIAKSPILLLQYWKTDHY